MDVEKANQSRKRNRTCSCIGTTVCIIIATVILVLILALTVFKAKRPVISYNNMSIKELDASFDMTNFKFKVHLNVTIDVDLSIKNPNKVGFKFSNSTAFLEYRGQLVGEVPIPADEISAGKTTAMNVSLTLLADRLLSNSDLYSDVKSGVLALSSNVRLSGKVEILVFKFHAVSTSSCDFSVNISNRTIADQTCKYKTQL